MNSKKLTESRVSRRAFLASALATGGAFLAACASGPNAPVPAAPQQTAPTEAPKEAASAPSVKLTVWGWDGTLDGVESQVESFKQKHDGTDVDVKSFGYDDVHTNLLNAIVAGSGAPDMCAIDVLRLTQYVDGIVDVSDKIKPYVDQFVSPTVALGSYKGKSYGLATDSEPMGVFYRKDIWDEHGIKEEEIKMWADLATAGARMSDASGGKVSLYAQHANDYNLFEVMAVQQGFGGYYFNDDDTKVIVDDPKIAEAVNALKQLWDAKGVSKNVGQGYASDEMTVVLKNNKVASAIIGPAWYPLTLTGQMPEQSGKWRLMRVPAIKEGGARVGYQYPTIFVIPKQVANPDATWDLAQMSLIGDGAKVLYEKTKVLPAYKPLLDELKPKGDDFFGGQKIYELWDSIAGDAPKVFFGVGFTEAQQIMGNALQSILNDKKSVDDGLKEAANEMRTKLKKG